MFDDAPCSTEPMTEAAAANRIVDHLEEFIGNFKFLSATARAHLEKEFEELRGYLPKH